MRKRASLLGGVATVAMAGAVAMTPTGAEAGGFALREQSAYSQGASFAGAATCGESIQGAFWNPAVVTCAQGLDFESTYSLIMPSAEVTSDPFPGSLLGAGGPFGNFGDPGDIGKDAIVPSSAVAYNFNDSLYFGLTINAAYGLATKTNYTHAAQYYGRTSEVFSLNAQPVVGYRVNDMISIAAGLQVQYFDVRLTQAVPAGPGFSPTDPTAILTGDDIAFGATAGILFTPMPGTEIGLGYRSRIQHDLEGTLEFPGAPALDINADGVDLPDMVSLGIRHQINDTFTLLGTVEWSNWSIFDTYDVTAPALGGAVVTQLPFEYDDGWFYSLGGEYRYNEQLTLRAGIGWEESPISDEVRSIRLPDNDRLWLSAGLSYDVSDRMKVNAGYSFLSTADTRIEYGPGNPHFNGLPYSADVDANVHIVSVGLKYSIGGAPEPVAPVAAPVYKP